MMKRCKSCGSICFASGSPIVTLFEYNELLTRAQAMADYLAELERHMPDEPIPCLDAYRELTA